MSHQSWRLAARLARKLLRSETPEMSYVFKMARRFKQAGGDAYRRAGPGESRHGENGMKASCHRSLLDQPLWPHNAVHRAATLC